MPYLLLGAFIFSCTPDLIFENEEKQNQLETKLQLNPKLVYKTPSTPEEISLTINLSKVSETVKKLYTDRNNVKIVNAAINAQVYTDESILLSDLIYPENSRLAASGRFNKILKSLNLDVKTFANNFWQEVNLTNDESYKSFLTQIKQPVYYQSNIKGGRNKIDSLDRSAPLLQESKIIPVSIYSPYSQRGGEPIDWEQPAPYEDWGGGFVTVVTATADADQGIGYMPNYSNGVFSHYTQVLVNDDYCELNPTHIIGLNGIEPYDLGSPVGAAFPPSGPTTIPGLARIVKQVYIGDVRVRKQYDALISFTNNGGGSEMKFTRADGYLKLEDGQTADTFPSTSRTVSRLDIKKRNWVSFSMEWDGDWEEDNKEQHFAIYEDDNRNQSEISGSIQTTLKKSDNVTLQVGPIAYKIVFKSDDAIITQKILKRDVFFTLNRTNLEGEMRNGWPVRDKGGDVSFTFNDRVLQP